MSQGDLPIQAMGDTPPVSSPTLAVAYSGRVNLKSHIPSFMGGAETKIDPKVLLAGLSITFLILAIIYSMADFAVVFDINEFSAEYKSPAKFALSYWIAYFRILFKAIVILLFVFIFIVIYDIVLVGFITPIISDNVDSSKNVSTFGGASDIIEASKEGYFKSINAVTENANKIVFGFIKMRYAILLMFVVVPCLIFCIAYVYYAVLCNEQSIPKEELQNVLKTSFHYMAMFIISLLAIILIYLVYTTLLDASQ